MRPFEESDFINDPTEAGVIFEHFVTALNVWVAMNDRIVTVSDAAAAFNTTAHVIERAVHENYWLFLEGEGPEATIEAEGL